MNNYIVHVVTIIVLNYNNYEHTPASFLDLPLQLMDQCRQTGQYPGKKTTTATMILICTAKLLSLSIHSFILPLRSPFPPLRLPLLLLLLLPFPLPSQILTNYRNTKLLTLRFDMCLNTNGLEMAICTETKTRF